VTRAGALTLSRAWDVCDRLTASIALTGADLHALEPAGDLRRYEPLVTSIVLVGGAAQPPSALAAIATLFEPHQIRERSDTRLIGVYERATIDIRVTSPEEFGTILFFATGSDAHVDAVARRELPRRRFESEPALYASVGLPYIPPELRHGSGEIDAARAGQMPVALEVAHMRGDLHMHTIYSDGRDSVETMIGGGHALGYEYIAITDHSAGAMAARTLGYDEIARQREEIDKLRERFRGLTILHGVEVDIAEDGRLDFPDAILEGFDIVLASLHEHHGHDAARLTARSLAAIRHPLVNVLCHPANRLVGHSDGYALDFDALYAAAAETGTALEIDGAPMHMDLDGDRARAAAAAGVTLTVDSDCHRVEALGRQMRFGVGTARRGWVGPQTVLNTRPLADVRAFIAAKRSGRPATGRDAIE
jgi:DNA polymerase (family 10)